MKIQSDILYTDRSGRIRGPFILRPEQGYDRKGGYIWGSLDNLQPNMFWESGRCNYLLETENDLISELSEDTGSEPPDYLFQRETDV